MSGISICPDTSDANATLAVIAEMTRRRQIGKGPPDIATNYRIWMVDGTDTETTSETNGIWTRYVTQGAQVPTHSMPTQTVTQAPGRWSRNGGRPPPAVGRCPPAVAVGSANRRPLYCACGQIADATFAEYPWGHVHPDGTARAGHPD